MVESYTPKPGLHLEIVPMGGEMKNLGSEAIYMSVSVSYRP